jgi:ABC-type lipoprotein release transport system permease subunit
MVDNVVSFYSGHIEIHQKGYWEEQTLDNSFVPNDTINTIIENQDKVAHWVPRLESFTLASSKDLTKGSMLIGIDPIAENKLTHLADKIVSGKYLGQKDVLFTTPSKRHAYSIGSGLSWCNCCRKIWDTRHCQIPNT